MKSRRTPAHPAFRAHAFNASVFEGVFPGESPSRLHRYRVRHGLRVGYERLGTDPWQLACGLWVATEAEAAELETSAARQLLNPSDDLPF